MRKGILLGSEYGGVAMHQGTHGNLAVRQAQFNRAMARYTADGKYRLFGYGVAAANVLLQGWLLWRIWPQSITLAGRMSALAAAWLLADLVNGLVHLYMDNNDRYDSLAGPLIANFHLHHKLPQYTVRPLPLVYVVESGSKIWLVPVLAAMALGMEMTSMSPWLLHLLVYFGIASSVAEVSHYLCHTSTSRLALLCGSCGILLDKRHHAHHHLGDNVNYAFLNGISDPLLNMIARRFGRGYKQHTDLHFATYQLDGESR